MGTTSGARRWGWRGRDSWGTSGPHRRPPDDRNRSATRASPPTQRPGQLWLYRVGRPEVRYNEWMRKRLISLAAVGPLSAFAPSAIAHAPGTDGGPADRGCAPVIDARYYVGASGRVSCGLARRIAAASIRGRRFTRWNCTGRRTSFGHCHGRGVRRGSMVHWAAND
jgi:hypothetical protein